MVAEKTDREWRIEEKKYLISECHQLRLEYGLNKLDDLNLEISALKVYKRMRERYVRRKLRKEKRYGR